MRKEILMDTVLEKIGELAPFIMGLVMLGAFAIFVHSLFSVTGGGRESNRPETEKQQRRKAERKTRAWRKYRSWMKKLHMDKIQRRKFITWLRTLPWHRKAQKKRP